MSVYEFLLKNLFFKIDPEKTHELAIKVGIFCEKHWYMKKLVSLIYGYKNKMLNIEVVGINFENPVGLAAGFDKNAVLTEIIPCIGFGFEEVGSITGEPCEGNPKPRLFRLPKDKAIAVNYGLCNEGAEIIAKRLQGRKFKIPIGMNIAKTNDKKIMGQASVNDYYKAYSLLKDIGNYVTINISCPNSGDGRSFEDVFLLEKLLKKIGKTKNIIFLKISPDLTLNNLDKIIKLSEKYSVGGFVVANLTHDKRGLKTSKQELSKIRGAISGPHTKEKSNDLIKYICKKTNGKFAIIGVGGVFNAEDAYEKIRCGASLIQLITSIIYKGPGIVKNINKGLVRLLEKDGYKTIKEVIGIDA